MASLGDKMVSTLFGQSEAEKTFRPWWDNLEDFLVYGLILLGKLIYQILMFIDNILIIRLPQNLISNLI